MRSRVKEMRVVKASDLKPHPLNWRLHPENQREAMRVLLSEIGDVSAIICRETEDGLQIIDGHMRAEMAGDELVNVLVVDLDDQEAAAVLGTFDKVSTLAIADTDAVSKILLQAPILSDFADLRAIMAAADKKAESEIVKEAEAYNHEPIGLQLQQHEHYDYIVVLCQTVREFKALKEALGIKTVQRGSTRALWRAVKASTLLDKMGYQA